MRAILARALAAETHTEHVDETRAQRVDETRKRRDGNLQLNKNTNLWLCGCARRDHWILLIRSCSTSVSAVRVLSLSVHTNTRVT